MTLAEPPFWQPFRCPAGPERSSSVAGGRTAGRGAHGRRVTTHTGCTYEQWEWQWVTCSLCLLSGRCGEALPSFAFPRHFGAAFGVSRCAQRGGEELMRPYMLSRDSCASQNLLVGRGECEQGRLEALHRQGS